MKTDPISNQWNVALVSKEQGSSFVENSVIYSIFIFVRPFGVEFYSV